MPRSRALVLALAAIVLALAGHAGARGRAGVVSGRVLLDGEPVAGAVVEAYDESRTELAMLDATLCLEHGKRCYEAEEALAALEGQPPRLATARTNAKGRFELRGLRASALSLWARDASGRRLAARTGVVTGGVHELALRAAGSISLRASDPAEAPAGGVPVRAFARGSARRFVAETGSDGEARLEGLPPGQYLVVTAHPGLLMPRGAEVMAAGARMRPHHLRLTYGRAIAGRVERDHAPVPGVFVRLLAGGPDQTIRTDENGRFVIPRVRGVGRAVVEAFTPDGQTSGTRYVRNAPEQVLTLHPSGTIAGTVRDENGNPVWTARVEWQTGIDQLRRAATTGGRGEFRLAPVHAGRWRLRVTADGFEAAAADGPRVRDGQTVTVEVTLRRTTRITGRVLDPDGRPVIGATVSARAQEAKSRGDGSFALEGLDEDDHALVVRAEGFGGIVVHANDTGLDVVARLGGATLSGRVLGEDRAPVLGADVFLYPAAEDSRVRLASTKTGVLGAFELPGVADGGYRLEVRRRNPEESQVQTTTVEVIVPRREAEPLVVSFDRGHRIQGRVLDPAGWPVAGATVRASSETTHELIAYYGCGTVERSSEARATTTADGGFVLEGLLPEPHRLFASTDAASAELPEVAPDREPVEVRLQWPTLARGRVADAAGRPVRRFTIGHERFEHASGEFEIEVGRGRALEIRAPGAPRLRVPILVNPGHATDLGEVRLPPTREVSVRVLSAEGRPLSGATLTVAGSSGDSDDSDAPHGVESDAAGLATLELPVDGARVLVSRADRAPRVVSIRPDERIHEVRLDVGASISGTLRDADGLPVWPGSVLVLGPWIEYEAIVDRSGGFRVDNLLPGEHRLLARHDAEIGAGEIAFRPATVTVPVAGTVRANLVEYVGGAELDVRIGGDRSWGLRGVFLLPAPFALPVPFDLQRHALWDAVWSRPVEEGRRTWRFRGLEPGAWTLVVLRRQRDGGGIYTETHTVPAGSRLRWDVVLPPDLPTDHGLRFSAF